MKERYLEIEIIHETHYFGQELSYISIAKGEIPLVPFTDDQDPENFWGATGGVAITVDGYKTIFRSTDFQYLVKVTNFLLHSLYWIKGKTNTWFDNDEEFPNDVIIRTTAGNVLKLQKAEDNNVQISFESIDKVFHNGRGLHFFTGEFVSRNEWFEAAKVALCEYFKVLAAVISFKPENPYSRTMKEYVIVWENARVL